MKALKIENLSKKYIIGHDKSGPGGYQYNSLRESVSHSVKGIFHKIMHPLSPNKSKVALEEFWALKNINFDVEQGDKIGIIGHNGAGKTTLLKILSRITQPSEGRIRIRGRVASLLEVGTGFHPELTGKENIYLNGAILGMKRAEIKRKFDEIVDFAEVEKFLDTPVKRYSSGMYVRLAFAVAAHLEPEILLVDEVLAVGDAAFQKKSIGKMRDISSQGRTIIFVSHNMAAIRKLCNHALLLNEGRIQKSGNVEPVIDNYFQNLHRSIENENFNIDDFRRDANEEKEIKVVEIKVNNKFNTSMDIGSVINVSLKIFSQINLDEVNVTIQLINSSGDVITTILSKDSRNCFKISKGINSISCRIEQNGMHLLPGKYFITTGITKFIGSKAYDVILNYPAFEIDNKGENALTVRMERPGILYHSSVAWNKNGKN